MTAIEMTPLTEDNRTIRRRVLDTWMRHLPQDIRDAMTLFGMSEDEYRRRIERQLFGPLIETTAGTTPTVIINPIPQPVQTWTDWPRITSGSVTCPAQFPDGWTIISSN